MIQFNSLKEATQYIPNCLLCRGHIDFSEVDVLRMWNERCGFQTTLIFKSNDLYRSHENTISIDLETEEVSRETKYIDNYSSSLPYFSSGKAHVPDTGDMYLGLQMRCKYCLNYNYVIQIIVNLDTLRIKNRILNSECVLIKEFDKTYSVKNIYTTNKTEYKLYGRPASFEADKTQELPLIPLDREHPQKTLKRIQNLLIFT
jgi:hypothetical protein